MRAGGEKAETTAADTKAETTAAKEDAKGAESSAEETKAGEEEAAGGTILMATNAEFEPWEFHDGRRHRGHRPGDRRSHC